MNVKDNYDVSKFIYKDTYINLLRTANRYENQDIDIIFDYSFNEYDIERFKRTYDLEALKEDTELKTFIKATNWVSKILKSDLEPNYPMVNAVDLINDVKNKKYAANCYSHAVVLNETFCALGYKCRYVFCLPVDFHITDCHVVNLVYSEEKKKWMLFDSAQNLYYTNDSGDILNIFELKNCIINDMNININFLEAFYSEREQGNIELMKKRILTYMSKNLYRFECFKNPQTDCFLTSSMIKTYNLVPLNYMQTPFIRSLYIKEKCNKIMEYYTADADKFWALPQL